MTSKRRLRRQRGKLRTANETPRETARRILAKHGLAFSPNRKPVPPEVFHDLDHDLGRQMKLAEEIMGDDGDVLAALAK
jgi:hypothetical protein